LSIASSVSVTAKTSPGSTVESEITLVAVNSPSANAVVVNKGINNNALITKNILLFFIVFTTSVFIIYVFYMIYNNKFQVNPRISEDLLVSNFILFYFLLAYDDSHSAIIS
jgi:hypothetical protein